MAVEAIAAKLLVSCIFLQSTRQHIHLFQQNRSQSCQHLIQTATRQRLNNTQMEENGNTTHNNQTLCGGKKR